ncbi:MAG: hypothetical protein AVDCRST_MAG88-3096 [uncultured Thermomicrobiales bacterium]|uniref:Uncharacterized protein n=1 Tax=uncultured Thermomicrobiales bacterium TaxID=1645740 RepID=A0A6J4VI73_9BACT|nr:MAG: hypothetical protein AVDCRST_MAG88-3096 [uncultured Thermomicrobiales bacterium]
MLERRNHDPLATGVRPDRLPARDFPNNITTANIGSAMATSVLELDVIALLNQRAGWRKWPGQG